MISNFIWSPQRIFGKSDKTGEGCGQYRGGLLGTPLIDLLLDLSFRGIVIQIQSAEEYTGITPAVVGMLAFASALPMAPTAIALAGA